MKLTHSIYYRGKESNMLRFLVRIHSPLFNEVLCNPTIQLNIHVFFQDNVDFY